MAATEPNPKYNLPTVYNKYQGCEGESEPKEDCSCCPPGLVAVYDECNRHLGCVTPNDAEHLMMSQQKCPEGYVKTIHPTTGEFLGCLPPADALSILNHYQS